MNSLDTPVLRNADTLDPKRRAHTVLFTTHERSPDAEEGGHDPHAEWDETVARAFGRILHTHYQGHDWNVWVSRKDGIAKIWLSCLMNPMFPYVLKLSESIQPGDVMRAGGEILERYGIPRSTIDFALMKDVRKKYGPMVTRMRPPGGLGKLA